MLLMLVWHLATRYLRTRRNAWLALAAVTLTVWLPIVALGVMHGFVEVTYRQVRATESDLVLQAPYAAPRNAELEAALVAQPEIAGMAPFAGNFAVMTPVSARNHREQAQHVIGVQAEGVNLMQDIAIGRLQPEWLHPAPVQDLKAPDLAPEQRGSGFLTPTWRAHLAWTGMGLLPQLTAMPLSCLPLQQPRPGAIAGRELIYSKFYGHLPVGQPMRLIIPNGLGGVVGKDMVEISDTVGTGVLVFDNTSIVVPLASGQRITGMWRDDAVSGYRLRLAPGVDLATGRKAVRRVAPGGWYLAAWDQLGSRNLVESLRVQRRVVSLMMILIQLMCVFILFAVFSTLVAEKRHDIGVLLGLGASRRSILGTFLAAGVICCLVGGLLGWALGWGFLAILNPLSDFVGFPLFPQDVIYTPEAPISWNPLIPLGFIGLSCLIGLISVLWPAFRASQVDPVHTLREAG